MAGWELTNGLTESGETGVVVLEAGADDQREAPVPAGVLVAHFGWSFGIRYSDIRYILADNIPPIPVAFWRLSGVLVGTAGHCQIRTRRALSEASATPTDPVGELHERTDSLATPPDRQSCPGRGAALKGPRSGDGEDPVSVGVSPTAAPQSARPEWPLENSRRSGCVDGGPAGGVELIDGLQAALRPWPGGGEFRNGHRLPTLALEARPESLPGGALD